MSFEIIVVGNGMVGQRFVELIRASNNSELFNINIFSEETIPAYDRVNLSSYFTDGPQVLNLVPEQFYQQDSLLNLWLGESVTEINRFDKTITTSLSRKFNYDALVIATGSSAFVPPIQGREFQGCFVYRTLQDLKAIERYASRSKVGAVIGGGLLGLEAANALKTLGLQTHVIEMAPYLMPQQLDMGASQALMQRIQDLDIKIHVEKSISCIKAGHNGAVSQIVFANDEKIDLDLVVFSAGIRPRDELGYKAGLGIGPKGGIVVDEKCQTLDPSIWAIGEVACVQGNVYGLVGPGYQMAEVVADQLQGKSSFFKTPDTSTKLKLLGVDVASFGDAKGITPTSLGVVYSDPITKTYKKMVIDDKAKILLGGILVGDISAYPLLKTLIGRALTDSVEQLLFQNITPSSGISIPDDAQICSCNAVSKAEIVSVIKDNNIVEVVDIKSCTKAGTSCGSCVPMLKTILSEQLEASGIVMSTNLCEHFELSRPELVEVIRKNNITSFSEVIGKFGHGHGCDICKPVVASILASFAHEHILDKKHLRLQDTNDRFLANIQKNGTYSVIPRIPGGEITPEKLIKIGKVAQEFNLYTKITGAQRIDLLGARVEQLPHIWKKLVEAGFESGHAYGKAVRTVKSCVGSTWCRYGVQDSVGMAIDLELRYRGLRSPHKIKMGVSGCARECAEARGKDVGVIATEKGWNLYLGGNGGFSPRHAQLFAQDLNSQSLVKYIDRFLMFYIQSADRLQRTAFWIETLDSGIDYLREVIIQDSLGICKDLDQAMQNHVNNYKDEWSQTLEDSEKLKDFVCFVNLPSQQDPDIVFVTERDQIKPLQITSKTF